MDENEKVGEQSGGWEVIFSDFLLLQNTHLRASRLVGYCNDEGCLP